MTITEPKIISSTQSLYTVSIPEEWVDNMIDIDKPEWHPTDHGDPLEDWMVRISMGLIDAVRGPSALLSLVDINYYWETCHKTGRIITPPHTVLKLQVG